MDAVRPVAIVGGASSGMFVRQVLRDLGRDFAGFLDDDPTRSTLGPLANMASLHDEYVVAVADCAERRRIVEKCGGVWPATLIHPTALVGDGVLIGEGTVIGPYAVIGSHAVIGDHVIVNVAASVAQASTIRSYCTLSPGARISGQNLIEAGTFVGTNAATRQCITVGAGVTIGVGAAVVNDLPPGVVVGGVPAKLL